jgi:hypothetical protein
MPGIAEDNPTTLDQQVDQLIERGKYQEALPIAERAVEVAKRTRGPEDPAVWTFSCAYSKRPKDERKTAQGFSPGKTAPRGIALKGRPRSVIIPKDNVRRKRLDGVSEAHEALGAPADLL